MAGYKQLVMNMKPVTYISFDGEQVNDGSKFIDSREIIDEMGNQHGIIQQEVNDPLYAGYRAGTTSMLQLDKFDQKAIRFCPFGANNSAKEKGHSLFPKAMITIPNNLAYDFSAGEFTYCFMANRGSPDYSDGKWEKTYYTDVIFDHNGIIRLTQSYSYNGNDSYAIYFYPLNKDVLNGIGNIIPSNLTGLPVWVLIRYKNFNLEVFVNGDLFASVNVRSQLDPNAFTLESGTKEFTLGGTYNNVNSSKYSDRLSRTYDIDAFAIFNRALTNLDITKLYRRVFEYDTMLLVDNPSVYYRMNDDSLRRGITSAIGGGLTIDGNYENARVRGKGKVKGTEAIHFTNNTSLKSNFNHGTILNLSSDYTIEFFFKLTSSDRGVLFHQGTLLYPYEQLTIWANSRRGNRNDGSIEIDLSCERKYIFIADDIRLNEWHHIIVRKNGDTYNVWIDGIECLYDYTHKTNARGSSTGASFLSAQNDNNYISAYLSTIIVYPKALSDLKIMAHSNYDSVYRIRGTVTLMGNPTNAVIRLYSHATGELLEEVESDPLTGVYMADLLSNERLDVFVWHRQDESVKFRAYGYLVPYEQDDSPFSI